jgi:hypothetical protein
MRRGSRNILRQQGALLLREGRDFQHCSDTRGFFRLAIGGEDAGQDELMAGLKVADPECL